jgi:hypothetical protein
MNCSYCNSPLEPNAKFCGECGSPVEQPAPPPPAPTVMAQDQQPQPKPPEPPPPAAAAQQPVYQPIPQEAPKQRRSGCTIIVVILAILAVCCLGTVAVGWYFLDNAEFDFSSSGLDMPFLDRLRNGDFPFLEQFFGEGTQEPIFDSITNGQVNLTLENRFDVPVCYVFISPSSSDEWGDDWLGDQEVISPGNSKTFQLEANQLMDISTHDCNGDLLSEKYEIDLSNEEILIILSPEP